MLGDYNLINTISIRMLALVLIGVAISFKANFALAAPSSAYDFKKPSTNSDVVLSPSGRYIGFTRIVTNKHCLNRYGEMVEQKKAKCKDKKKSYRTKHEIAIFDLEKWEPVKKIPLPENLYVSWLEWASDDRLLAALYRPTTTGTSGRAFKVGGSRILSIPIKGGTPIALFASQRTFRRQNRYLTRITNLLRNDPEHIVMPANRDGALDLWKVNVLTGFANRIAQGKAGTFYWYTDRYGVPILRFDCAARRCLKINVFGFDQTQNLSADNRKAWSKIKTFRVKPDEDEDDYDFWPIAPAAKKGQFYVMSNEDSAERRSIKIFDIKSQKYIETVYEHPTVDVGGAMLDTKTGEYAGAWFYEDRLNYSFQDPEIQKHYKGLNAYFKDEENIDLLGFNNNGDKAVIYVTSPNNPGEYYVYNIANSQAVRLFSRRTDMEERLPSKTEILTIPTRDGNQVTAYWSYPTGKKNTKTPLLVLPHGGPEVRDYYGYNSNVQYFTAQGYQVLQVNFRGSSGFGRKFAEAGYGEWGGLMQTDVIDAVQHLYDNGLAIADNACMVGYSYGGYVALYAGATTPEMFKCIVSGGGVSDLLADLKQTRGDYGADSESYEYWLKSMGNPKTDKLLLAAKSPLFMAEKFTAPVLLIHGEDDSVVDVSQSKRMYKALKKAGADVEFVKLKDEGHKGWDLETKIIYLETIDAFLSTHLTK
jgi:dipeptidyl aminopeptidase/acylaminoacyl peptidase